jgi:flagellar protein FlbD
MIKVTRLNHTGLILNSDLIEHIEITPDTVITLSSGQKFMVLESAEEIVGEVITFRRSLLSRDLICPMALSGGMQRTNPSCQAPTGDASSHGT